MAIESNSYWESVRPTYLENWPDALKRLSIDQVDVPLSMEEALALGSNIVELYELFPGSPGQDISGIRERLNNAIGTFSSGAFVRLGSRSPKDSWLGHHRGFRVTNSQQALELLCDVSERIADDLLRAIHEDYAPHIFARRWIDIPAWAEFRCFMKDRALVGISQYNHFAGRQNEIISNTIAIQKNIETFFPSFREACHLETVVFDITIKQSQVTLLEINPFFEFTDPCLFQDQQFDGSFRYCLEPARKRDLVNIIE